VLAEVHGEACGRAEMLAGRIRRPDAAGRARLFRLLGLFAAAAAIVIAFYAARWGREPLSGEPEIIPTRVVVIEGMVRDDAGPPEFIEVDGKSFPVKRVSATEGAWMIEVEVASERRDVLLCAVDANGNRSFMNVRLVRREE